MAIPTAARVTRREREILNVVFALGNRASADEIRQRLADPPSDSSVRVMLARLEQKGLVRHAVDGVRFVYSATRSPAAAGRSALNELVQTFYNGSTVQLMTALVRRGTWSNDELDTLEAAIEAARTQERLGKTSEP
jgi:predicted transcriptional regulator